MINHNLFSRSFLCFDPDSVRNFSRSHDRYEVTGYEDTTGTNGDATMPPPVQLTKRFQEPINYDSTLEMPSPPMSPLKPYSYPSPSPPLDDSFPKTGEMNYPNVKYYQNQGFNASHYSGDRFQEKD